MQDKTVALVTGANSGIGKQVAKELLREGYLVVIGARKLDDGCKAAEELGGEAAVVQIDVTDAQSIAQAAQHITDTYGRLDLLVNNAGIVQSGRYGSTEEAQAASKASVASLDEVRKLFETNAFGALAVSQAMLRLIRQSPSGRIVNVTSGTGSLTLNSDPNFEFRPFFGATYTASKTALNAMTMALAIDLEDSGIKVRAASPSFTNTALNNFKGGDDVEVGARPVVRAALDTDSPTGSFTGPDGAYPW